MQVSKADLGPLEKISAGGAAGVQAAMSPAGQRQHAGEIAGSVLRNHPGIERPAWTLERNRALVEARGCLTVWLDAPFDLCWQRARTQDNQRPFARDEAKARKLYERRRAAYAPSPSRSSRRGANWCGSSPWPCCPHQ